MIDIELACGWRVVGTTARPRGLRIMDGDKVVDGVMGVTIDVSPTGFPAINVKLHPKLDKDASMDPPPEGVFTVSADDPRA